MGNRPGRLDPTRDRRPACAVDDSKQILLWTLCAPSVDASDVAYCQEARCPELSEFVLLCDKYDELQKPPEMARWINDHCLDCINIDSAAAQTARAGDLGPARRQTLAMIRTNRKVWSVLSSYQV